MINGPCRIRNIWQGKHLGNGCLGHCSKQDIIRFHGSSGNNGSMRNAARSNDIIGHGFGKRSQRKRFALWSKRPQDKMTLETTSPVFGINIRDVVLHGGEEYALLFTSSLRESELSTRLKRPVYAIGRIVATHGVRVDGQSLEAEGWDHFA